MTHPDATVYRIDAAGAHDELRGRRGTFKPIPDVQVTHLTRGEAAAYERFRRFYRRQWGRVDPVAMRFVLRTHSDPGGEPDVDRLDVSVDILPFARNAYQALRLVLGPSSTRTLRPFSGEILGVDFMPGALLSSSTVGSAYMRLGVFDHEVPMVFEGDTLQLEHLRDAPDLYAILPTQVLGGRSEVLFLGVPRDEKDGVFRFDTSWFSRTSWGARHGDLAVLSFDPAVTTRLVDNLEFDEGLAAQARSAVESLGETRVARLLKTQNYLRSRGAARSSARFLSLLYRELKVPRAECARVARRILGADLVCPAGGNFVSSEYPVRGSAFFRSDAFPQEAGSPSTWIREARQRATPLLRVLRRLRVGMSLEGRNLHSDIELEMVAKDLEAK